MMRFGLARPASHTLPSRDSPNGHEVGVHHVGHRPGRNWIIVFGQAEEDVEHAGKFPVSERGEHQPQVVGKSYQAGTVLESVTVNMR